MTHAGAASIPMLDHLQRKRYPSRRSERGQVLILTLMLMLVGVGAGLLIYNLPRPAEQNIQRDKITAAALAEAKLALIGFATGVNLTSSRRPGDLPCPDLKDNGEAESSCGSAAGSNQAQRLGRLPWKTLGLPDLRDGYGERLWYAVSNNFKNNFRTTCTSPGQAGCLNSDARGTITVRDSTGNVINDGANPDQFTPSGVIAVIFAPGAILQRQGAAGAQDRSCTGGICNPANDTAGVCTSSPFTLTPKCNPINYLDILTGVEDNADFTDGSSTNGFINGVIRDASNNAVVNDRLISITYNDLMPALQRRVAKEVLNCLNDYAALTQNGGPTNGRYPWAVPVNDWPTYTDKVNTRFGRLPDTPFSDTPLGVPGGVAVSSCPTTSPPTVCMKDTWPPGLCNIPGSWWTNWKEIVFYGVADEYQPADPNLMSGVPASGGCGSCLRVDPPSSSDDKRVVVAVAGKRLSDAAYNQGNDQPRSSTSDKQDPRNYLEGENESGSVNRYEQQPISASFSDFLLYR